MTRTISIISGKGGVGKTTMALNMASALSNHYRKRTALVDCNLTTSHLGLHLGSYHYPKTLNHVLRGEASIHDATYHIENGMHLIPASISLRDLDGIDVFHLQDKVKELQGRHDIVLLDAAPGFGREALGALKAADESIIVANPNILSLTDVIRCIEVCQECGSKPLGIILNMVHKDKYEIPTSEIERLTGLPVLAQIPYHRGLRRSTAFRSSLVSLKPTDRVSRDIIRLSSFIAQEPYPYFGFREKMRKYLF